MRNFRFLALILTISIFASGCQISQQLSTHRKELDRLAYGENVSKLDKFDGLATILATALDESTSLTSPLKTYKYVTKFSTQNEAALKSLVAELEPWQANMNQAEKIQFTARSLAKPYSRKLIRVVPKVQKMVSEEGYSLGPLEKVLILFKLKKMLKK